MAPNALRIGLFGCGTVGSGVVELLASRKEYLIQAGVQASVAKICVRNPQKINHLASQYSITTKYDDILKDSSINCVIELIGGVTDAKDIVIRAIQEGKHVITANKALVANHMQEIKTLLAQHPQVRFGYEASVAGGIPIIHTMQGAYTSDQIQEVAGIMNGTTNYMLTKMEKQGMAYADVLKEAQDLGFAEADPSADVDGYDVQAKIAILAKLAYGGIVNPKDIPTTGISRIKTVDFEYAALMQSTIKLLGIAKRSQNEQYPNEISVFVSPVVVPSSNVIANINGASNIINIRSSNLNTSAYVGEGAGCLPTANSVLNDIIQLGSGLMPSDPFLPTTTIKIQNDYETKFYVRIKITDGVGIIRQIGETAENAGVSIYSILQLPIVDPKNVDFVVVTDHTCLSKVQNMCNQISKLGFVQESPLFLPIL